MPTTKQWKFKDGFDEVFFLLLFLCSLLWGRSVCLDLENLTNANAP